MTLEELNNLCKDTFIDLLNIEFTGITDAKIEAVMMINPDLCQPTGVVHGGALISLAETVGSAGSFLLVDTKQFNTFGSTVYSQHLAPARSGGLHATAEIVVKNDFKHVWDVKIRDDEGNLVSISRVTNSIRRKKDTDNLN
ncbi:MAG TPA: PaaI family thioesterase [Bacteroides sp.]|nr:PaaI family thioesterase [Bacteroides sp.]